MKKKLPKYQVGNSNSCGPGTVWDDVQKKCIPAPQSGKVDPVFDNALWGNPQLKTQQMPANPYGLPPEMIQQGNSTGFGKGASQNNGVLTPSEVMPIFRGFNNEILPDISAGRKDNSGTFVPQRNVIGDALDKGFNYDSDGVYRKTETTTDPNNLVYSDGFKALNIGLDLTKFIAGTVNDAKTSKKEREKYLKSIQQDPKYNQYEQGLNNVPAYFKTGGSISIEKAKEMLKDGKVHGQKLTKKQKGLFGLIASGRKLEFGGMPNQNDFPDYESYSVAMDAYIASLGTGPDPLVGPPEDRNVYPVEQAPQVKTTKPVYKGDSIVDYLKSQDQPSSKAARKELAKTLGIKDYNYSAAQNLAMLDALTGNKTVADIPNIIVKKPQGSNTKKDNPYKTLDADLIRAAEEAIKSSETNSQEKQQAAKTIAEISKSNKINFIPKASEIGQGKKVGNTINNNQRPYSDAFILKQIENDPQTNKNINKRNTNEYFRNLALTTAALYGGSSVMGALTTRYLPYGLTELPAAAQKLIPYATRALTYQKGGMVDNNGYPIPTKQQYLSDPEFYGEAPSKRILDKYSSMVGDGTGQPIPDSQYGKLLNNLSYMKNNIWTESNVYRPENMHITANYSNIKQKQDEYKDFAQTGGLVNNTGYTPGTNTYNNPYNIIPSGDITMENTPFDVMAYPNNGKPTLMKAGGKYKFPNADYVTEVPMKTGGAVAKTDKALAAAMLNGNRPLSEKAKRHFQYVLDGKIPLHGHTKDAKAKGTYQIGGEDEQEQVHNTQEDMQEHMQNGGDNTSIVKPVPQKMLSIEDKKALAIFQAINPNDKNRSTNFFNKSTYQFYEITPDDIKAYIKNPNSTPKAKFIKTYDIYQNGGDPSMMAELEQGEVFQTQQGEITKVPESEDRHEDGGSVQTNVQRVLEDTGDKRKDMDSKLLRISPDEAEELVNFRPKRTTTHSKLYEEAKKRNDSKLKSFEKKLKDNMDYIKYTNGGKFAQNSLDENLKLMEQFPTNGDIFDTIYNHQEEVKHKYAIDQEEKEMKKGGMPKYQNGTYGNLTPWTGDKYQNKKNASMYSKDQWGQKLIAKGYKGDFSNLDVQKFLYTTPQGKAIIDNLHTTKPGTIFGDPAQNRFDEKLGYRWDAALDAVPDVPKVPDVPNTPDVPKVPDVPDKYTFNGSGTGKNRFNEPLRWYDTMPKVANYLSTLDRTPVDLEQLQYNPLKVHEETALPTIMQNQGDFNAGLQMLPTNGVGFANQANLMGNKYAVNQQAIAGVESRNKQKFDQIDAINNQGQMQIDATNLQLRDQFNTRILQGKEAQRLGKLNAFDDYATMVAQNRKLNREGNLVLQLTPYFDQNGEFNGKKYENDANIKELEGQTGLKTSVEEISGKTYVVRRNANNEIVSTTVTSKSKPTKIPTK